MTYLESLFRDHFVALSMFALAAFMLGAVAGPIAAHLLGRRRERERELRDLLWREVEVTLELERLRAEIKAAPVEVRTRGLALALDQARQWSERLRDVAQRYGFAAPLDEPRRLESPPDFGFNGATSIPRSDELRIESAWNAPVSGD